MSSRKTAGRRGTTKKRAQRATSNVFAMFNQDQIQEFKEDLEMMKVTLIDKSVDNVLICCKTKEQMEGSEFLKSTWMRGHNFLKFS